MNTPASPNRLPRSLLVFYALPAALYLALSMPLQVWFLKYATDYLLVAPGVIGTILLLSRLWDAVSDPMAGYLSDRTRSRLGRRRSWMIGAAVPVAVTFVMVWSPPASLTGLVLVAWVAVALLLWETASTAYYIPYSALGLELSSDYHERTRLFAWRHMITVIGYGGSLGLIFLMRTAEDPREMAFWCALGAGSVSALLTIFCAVRLPEPRTHQGRGGTSLLESFRDVFRNPHARKIFVLFGVESFGMGIIGTLSAFIMDDLLGRLDLLEALLACWMIPQIALAPLWVRLARRFGKKRLWLFGQMCTGVAFLALVLIRAGSWPLVFFSVILIGVGSGVGNVISPSMQADVVDYDELMTGERKEGAYTAVWNFIRKAGSALAAGSGGLVLSLAGYDPAAEIQSELVRDTIRWFVSLVPAAMYAIGIAVLWSYGLNQAEHAEVMAQIHARETSE